MELQQLRCFVAVAETLHFGRAAQNLNVLPASLGRQIKMLEESMGARLLARTTRNVSLTEVGRLFLPDAREMVERADKLIVKFRGHTDEASTNLRVGVIDSAAAGLIPQLLPKFQAIHPRISVQLVEQKSIRLLPKILSGRLDIAIIRPPIEADSRLKFEPLFYETPVVAVPLGHRLAERDHVNIQDMEDEPLIVPDLRSRPHSHDLSIHLFTEIGLSARIVQVAEEKQTIVNLVSSGIGLAIVPRWTKRLNVGGVRFLPLNLEPDSVRKELALSVCWLNGARDPAREYFLTVLNENLSEISKTA